MFGPKWLLYFIILTIIYVALKAAIVCLLQGHFFFHLQPAEDFLSFNLAFSGHRFETPDLVGIAPCWTFFLFNQKASKNCEKISCYLVFDCHWTSATAASLWNCSTEFLDRFVKGQNSLVNSVITNSMVLSISVRYSEHIKTVKFYE